MLELNFGDPTQAKDYLEESLLIARETNNTQRSGSLLTYLGAATIAQKDLPQAEAYLQESLTQAHHVGDQARAALSLAYLGAIAISLGDYAKAVTCLEESLATVQTIGLDVDIHTLRSSLAAIHLQCGHLDQAEQCLCQELPGLFEQDDPFPKIGQMACLVGWGDLCLRKRDLDTAETAFQRVATVQKWAESTQNTTNTTSLNLSGIALYGLAQIAADKGEITKAQQMGQESLNVMNYLDSARAAEITEWLTALT